MVLPCSIGQPLEPNTQTPSLQLKVTSTQNSPHFTDQETELRQLEELETGFNSIHTPKPLPETALDHESALSP